MKNIIKLFGIMALVVVIGFSMIACDDDSGGGGGSFTLTGIPSEHDGKYAYFQASDSGTILIGCQSITSSSITLVKISGGKVSLPTHRYTGSGYEKYTGKDTFNTVTFGIYNTATYTISSFGEPPVQRSFSSVSFSSGSASRTWSQGQ